MNALTFQGKQHISYTKIPDSQLLHDTDAIVKVTLCAICGSDLHVYHARETGLDCGTAMGHEFVGEIVALGKKVVSLKKGDQVLSPFTTNCGNCYYCCIGLTCRCVQGQLYGWVQNGLGLHGGQAQYVRVPLADSTLVKFNQSVSPEEALLIGDVRSTGFYCAHQADIQAQGVYAVVGCGPVGLMAIIAAQELGAEKVYAIDNIPERLNLAQQFGAIPINFTQQNALAIIQEATQGRGVDAVMECVGSPAASRLSFDLIRFGGTISTVGVHTSTQFTFSPMEAYDKNVNFKIGRSPARYYLQQLLNNTPNSPYDICQIITHQFKLAEGAAAYTLFDKKQDGCIKVVLRNE